MSVEDVRSRVAELGSDVDRDVVFVPPGSDPRGAPSHRWVVAENRSGATLVGGNDRGEFAAYETYDDQEEAAQAVHRLLGVEVPADRDDLDDLYSRAEAVDRGIRAASSRVVADQFEVGTPWDHIGNESGHYLYLFDTPMPSRSLPPTDLNEPRTGYLLARTLPPGLAVQLTPPWFGQPGGALVLRLERAIAVYVENGYLERFSVRR